MRDEIYKDKVDISKFTFDQKVVDVFDDMVLRSVPGYKQMIELIGLASRLYPVKDSSIYDLGCSTGAATLSILSNLKIKGIKIFSVDNSPAMVAKCQKNLTEYKKHIHFVCEDILSIEFERTSLVILNLTLQFIKPEKRLELITKIYDALIPGGALIISEKVTFEDSRTQEEMTALHEVFKKENGYSKTEISKKRKALENVLIPDSIEQNLDRLKKVKFTNPVVQMQCLNFVSFLAIK